MSTVSHVLLLKISAYLYMINKMIILSRLLESEMENVIK